MNEPTKPQAIDVEGCSSCGGGHKQLALTPYNAKGFARDHPYWTHHGTCPVTGDPVSFAIQPETGIALPEDVLHELAKGVKSGRWMAAVWLVAGDRLDCYRKCGSFPTTAYARAVEQLAAMLRQEVDGPEVRDLQPAELPDRPLFTPRIANPEDEAKP